jgi:hypothetical protein
VRSPINQAKPRLHATRPKLRSSRGTGLSDRVCGRKGPARAAKAKDGLGFGAQWTVHGAPLVPMPAGDLVALLQRELRSTWFLHARTAGAARTARLGRAPPTAVLLTGASRAVGLQSRVTEME